ncbi:T9SS type B sorting domain-containing protein [Allomuricauda sp. SCSIO 65647]|uniref:T9SS type B sorting domain-containing protein n=1 Tax=Allomuricauda sp. SCSIO 65647 TaxID=2908843 RepID=UPI001F26512E|nr:T9SS type B sorting domain-containing protein [Muricauda sp. SCSIO 65647]UJH66821.1 T9SS type B sorting domain-containing protein [Muricauda sp. SCSIO 65647]
MLKKLLFFSISLLIFFEASGQACPNLISPRDGDIDVPVDVTLSWNAIEGVPSYFISIGTTPGGRDIVNEQGVGSNATFQPPLGLPENSQIYVTITLFFFNQSNIVCATESFRTEDVTTAPDCTPITNIEDGDTGVSVFTNIRWSYAPTATGYRITIGTAPGLNDLFDGDVGNVLSFNPPFEFTPETTFYVRVIPYNENGPANNCDEISFTTREVAPLPDCTNLVNPLNGAINVPLTPFIEWVPVPNATGYYVTIGTTPNGADILDNATFISNATFVINFTPNTLFFITITPFNESGAAIGCGQETFSTLLGCGPYLDVATGEFVDLHPEFEFPSVFSFCENEEPLVLTAPIIADGYRWFGIDQLGNSSLLSEDRDLTVSEAGQFQLEVYDFVTQPGDVIECATLVDFEVVSSEAATIDRLDISDSALGLRVEVIASGNGDYEYAIDNIDGPYQDSNVFNNIPWGNHTVYVRDKNGCGITEESFEQDLTVEGFPKFFSPNGDGINDFWQFVQPEGQNIVLTSIRIFDRFGVFLAEIDQSSQGWDGTLNGRDLPSSDYWFQAIDESNREVKGHFSLKR